MVAKIFIDGREGTTGLQIYDRLAERDDIELLTIEESKRKDTDERKKLINTADIVFLCLPDNEACAAVGLVENDRTRIIDASSAHRTNRQWVYGFPELSEEQSEKIKNARFVANPGCHATGFIAAVYPLVSLGIMPRDYPLTCFSLTGYSGGGKKMISDYENDKTDEMYAPRIYALNQRHKHLPEMVYMTGLTRTPVFCPIVDDYYQGLAVTVTLHNNLLRGRNTAGSIRAAYADFYDNREFIKVAENLGSGMLSANLIIGTNNLLITVCGNEELTTVTAQLDNLGKGASAAAVQNMNLML